MSRGGEQWRLPPSPLPRSRRACDHRERGGSVRWHFHVQRFDRVSRSDRDRRGSPYPRVIIPEYAAYPLLLYVLTMPQPRSFLLSSRSLGDRAGTYTVERCAGENRRRFLRVARREHRHGNGTIKWRPLDRLFFHKPSLSRASTQVPRFCAFLSLICHNMAHKRHRVPDRRRPTHPAGLHRQRGTPHRLVHYTLRHSWPRIRLSYVSPACLVLLAFRLTIAAHAPQTFGKG